MNAHGCAACCRDLSALHTVAPTKAEFHAQLTHTLKVHEQQALVKAVQSLRSLSSLTSEEHASPCVSCKRSEECARARVLRRLQAELDTSTAIDAPLSRAQQQLWTAYTVCKASTGTIDITDVTHRLVHMVTADNSGSTSGGSSMQASQQLWLLAGVPEQLPLLWRVLLLLVFFHSCTPSRSAQDGVESAPCALAVGLPAHEHSLFTAGGQAGCDAQEHMPKGPTPAAACACWHVCPFVLLQHHLPPMPAQLTATNDRCAPHSSTSSSSSSSNGNSSKNVDSNGTGSGGREGPDEHDAHIDIDDPELFELLSGSFQSQHNQPSPSPAAPFAQLHSQKHQHSQQRQQQQRQEPETAQRQHQRLSLALLAQTAVTSSECAFRLPTEHTTALTRPAQPLGSPFELFALDTLLAYLRLLGNTVDCVAMFRALAVPNRKLSPGQMATLLSDRTAVSPYPALLSYVRQRTLGGGSYAPGNDHPLKPLFVSLRGFVSTMDTLHDTFMEAVPLKMHTRDYIPPAAAARKVLAAVGKVLRSRQSQVDTESVEMAVRFAKAVQHDLEAQPSGQWTAAPVQPSSWKLPLLAYVNSVSMKSADVGEQQLDFEEWSPEYECSSPSLFQHLPHPYTLLQEREEDENARAIAPAPPHSPDHNRTKRPKKRAPLLPIQVPAARGDVVRWDAPLKARAVCPGRKQDRRNKDTAGRTQRQRQSRQQAHQPSPTSSTPEATQPPLSTTRPSSPSPLPHPRKQQGAGSHSTQRPTKQPQQQTRNKKQQQKQLRRRRHKKASTPVLAGQRTILGFLQPSH
ncbi:hypothetical protein PTSG_01291 [Salpingoeca rosetta]|uniref:PCNA-interacting partner n=1 Tax=Salpingoeca rosetta (strain ATCC 50818 / BSB-021) TaxID=946362 RepID=F2TZX3_SALR5|nr:uncharacterized protein PTSG_01291 [Salpingoeca rosetta]EGD80701.1 hypothetical protein PTSG_01291 [Salpingoeca rosetta]|eukprot:XP_004997262.1 hypothetical protein PTSG_01291 [Salpingoeca rosetta]